MLDTAELHEVEIESSCLCDSDCYGDCYTDSVDNFNVIVKMWLEANKGSATDTVRIDGVAMGWESRSGYAVVEVAKILPTMTLNGDYRLRFSFDGKELTAQRWSHDEPMGSPHFVFSFVADDYEM